MKQPMEVNRRKSAVCRARKRLRRRLKKKQYADQAQPMMAGQNLHYEFSDKSNAMGYGGIGAIHKMVKKIGLDREIDSSLDLLKIHVPYHESDHVLNLAYNAMVGGVRLEDIELRRNDVAFMNALGAERIPDPTTAGDFTRRFGPNEIVDLMGAINRTRQRVWPASGLTMDEAIIDVDGTSASTQGQCKQGMDINHKGVWGYHPLVVSLANTNEVLYLVNRPGNVVSHEGAAQWIDRAVDLVKPHADRVLVRGDTDFSLTRHFDRWSEQFDFVFGVDNHPTFVGKAEALEACCWQALERAKPAAANPRAKRPNVKQRLVDERGYKKIRLIDEHVAEFDYRPTKCTKKYRMVVVRKNLSVRERQASLFDDIRYFFYATTRRDLSAAEVVAHANRRCNQENVIAQLKGGVNAMRMPVNDLNSNWAYMVMTALAWNLKAWFGLLIPNKVRRGQVIRMEFRRFLHTFVLLPCQVIRTGRRIVCRILAYNDALDDFFAAFERIRCLQIE